jgi:hypothetical protein
MLSTYEFPHSIDTVYYELTDRDRLMKRYDALGEEVISFHSVHVGLELILTVDRRIHRDVPKMLRNVINSAQVTKMSEKWWPADADWRGEHHIEIVGQPVAIDATFELIPTKGGCKYVIGQRPTVSIPLVRRKVEKILEKQLSKGFFDLCNCVNGFLR